VTWSHPLSKETATALWGGAVSNRVLNNWRLEASTPGHFEQLGCKFGGAGGMPGKARLPLWRACFRCGEDFFRWERFFFVGGGPVYVVEGQTVLGINKIKGFEPAFTKIAIYSSVAGH
jgi:hypothetical protein